MRLSRHRKQKTQADLAEQGAEILRGYQHPEDWIDGIRTRESNLYGKQLLQVWEIRPLTSSRTEENIQAIETWRKEVGLRSEHLSFEHTRRGVVFVAVPKYLFDEVLDKLNTL